MACRVQNCAFLVANATKNFAPRDQDFTTGRQQTIDYVISRHDNYTKNNFDFQQNQLK